MLSSLASIMGRGQPGALCAVDHFDLLISIDTDRTPGPDGKKYPELLVIQEPTDPGQHRT